MIAVMCIDDNNGILFNRRRLSQDKLLRRHMLQMIGESHLWMNSYSKKQFTGSDLSQIITDDNFLENAGNSDYCFIEDTDITPYADKINKIILFRWNRIYPADTYFPLDLGGWLLAETIDFEGYSHDKITKVTYTK